MFDVDWGELFIPSGSLAEIAVRGTVIYLALFAAMRLLPRREIGGLGPSDILVIVLIADAVQNGMAGEYRSITEGLLLVGVIFGWTTLVDWVDYRFPALNLAEARPLAVIRNGRLQYRNMKRDMLSEDELMAQLRAHGLDSPRDVVVAYVEGDGKLSILLRGGGRGKPADRSPAQQGGG